jgi:mannan endo-1,4-beta-mannosidase
MEFVRLENGQLRAGPNRFTIFGNNTYFFQPNLAYGWRDRVSETLDVMQTLDMNTVRSNAHNEHPVSQDPAAILEGPGKFRQQGLLAMDESISMAKDRGFRVILKLTNYWSAYGGVPRWVEWHLGRPVHQSECHLFYTNPELRAQFKEYVQAVLERKNSFTGIAYRDEPAILAWELGNELRNPGDTDQLHIWSEDIANFIKHNAPRQLVADGGEGFDHQPHLWPNLSSAYPVDGSEGARYSDLIHIDAIDLFSYHLYPHAWSMNDAQDVEVWIRGHEELAKSQGKASYMGEFGKRDLSDPERAAIYDQWLAMIKVSGCAGSLVWQLVPNAMHDAEGYQIHASTDRATFEVLRRYGKLFA